MTLEEQYLELLIEAMTLEDTPDGHDRCLQILDEAFDLQDAGVNLKEVWKKWKKSQEGYS